MSDRNDALQPIDSAVTPRFAQVATFMRTPAVASAEGLDIALAVVPFDLGSTIRAGGRAPRPGANPRDVAAHPQGERVEQHRAVRRLPRRRHR